MLSIRLTMRNLITHLLPETTISMYFTIFSTFIQIRHQRKILTSQWKDLQISFRFAAYSEDRDLDASIKKIKLLRCKIESILIEYESFVYQYCIPLNWSILKKKLTRAHTFNRIYIVHHEYLENVFRMSFFGRVQSDNFKPVLRLLQSVNDMATLISMTLNTDIDNKDWQYIEDQIEDMMEGVVKDTKIVRLFIQKTIVKSEGKSTVEDRIDSSI